MVRRRVIRSDSDLSPPPSGKANAEEDLDKEEPPRRAPTREAARNAHKAWDPIAPKSRGTTTESGKDRATVGKSGAPKPKPKSVSASRPSQLTQSKYSPPDICLDTSGDEELVPHARGSTSFAAKKLKGDQASERIRAPEPPSKTAKGKAINHKPAGKQSTSAKARDSDSDGETEDEVDESPTSSESSNESSSESSGLEGLFKDPSAVEARFAAERATWVDEDAAEEALDNNPSDFDNASIPSPANISMVSPMRSPACSPGVRSPVGSCVRSPVRSIARSPVGSPIHSPVHSAAGSPLLSPIHSPAGSPFRSPVPSPVHSAAGSPLLSPIHSPAGSPFRSPVPSPVHSPPETLEGSCARSSHHQSARSSSNQAPTSRHRSNKRRRDSSPEDEPPSRPSAEDKEEMKKRHVRKRHREQEREMSKRNLEHERKEHKRKEKERESQKQRRENEKEARKRQDRDREIRAQRQKGKEDRKRREGEDYEQHKRENGKERNHSGVKNRETHSSATAHSSTSQATPRSHHRASNLHRTKGLSDDIPTPAHRQKRKRQDEEITWVKSHAEGHRARKRSDLDDDELPSDCDDDDDDERIDILCLKGPRPNLLDQYPRVHRVAVHAIKEVETYIGTVNAFPEGDSDGREYLRSILIKHATNLKYKDMVNRLRDDKNKYWTKFASIPGQRVSLFRGKVKKLCEGVVRGIYGLTIGDAAKVTWLLTGIAYTFPHDYAAQSVVRNQPFGVSIFEDMLQAAFFNKRTSYGHRVSHLFTSSLPEQPDEKEIPAAMLALVSTAIYAAIDDFKFDRYETQKFEANTFIQAYRKNIETLSKIKSKNVAAYHRLMHGFYVRVAGSVGRSSMAADPTDYLDVEGMT